MNTTETTKIPVNKWLIVLAKCLLFAACAGALTALSHMLCDKFILHTHGKPDFLSTSLIIFSACDKILMGLGYYILGRKIPAANPILRCMAYLSLHWISNFVPQFMGLAFADGPIAEHAFHFSDLVCDSISLFLSGLLLALLFYKEPYVPLRSCKKGAYPKAILAGAVSLPCLVLVLDQLLFFINPAFSSASAIQVSAQAKPAFLVNFYSWFILSGIFICVFYRVTEYNDNGRWLSFALKYGLLLWTPVVMIMAVFGAELLPTAVYALLFLVCILAVSWMNGRILRE